MKKQRFGALVVIALMLAGLMAACGDTNPAPFIPGQSANVIRIYSSLPLTGTNKKQSDTMVNAMNMAVDDATNGTRKIGQYTIDYQSLDDSNPALGQWDGQQEAANAQKAVADPDTMVYVGTFNSGAAKVALPITNRAALAMVSPANEYSGLTRAAEGITAQGEPNIYYPGGGHSFFRVVTPDDVQAPAAATFVVNTLKPKSVYIIDDSQLYGKALADGFALALKNTGITVLDKKSITGKEADYKILASSIKDKNPDLIYFGGITQQQAGKLLNDIRVAGIKAPFMSGSGIVDETFIKDAGQNSEGVYALSSGVDDSKLPPKGQDFLKRYKQKYGDYEPFTIYAYEAMSVALNGIKTAGKKDRLATLFALAATKDFDGVFGKWSFDQNGDISITDFKILQVKNGKWAYIDQIHPKM